MNERDLLESDALRAYTVFAQHRNFTTAATELRISQPSLHVKIRKLGESLGLELYRREGRGLTLTAAGERLAAFAEESLRRVEDFVGELREDVAVVRIAAGRATLRWVISPVIQAITRSGRTVQVLTANREVALAALNAGRADVAVVALEPPPPPLRSRRVASFQQVLVVPARHPLGTRERVSLSDLDGLDLVVPPSGRPHRTALDRALREAGASWQVAAEVDGWDLLVHFAALGLGATIVNGCVQLPARLRAIPVVDLPAVRYWAAWRPERHRALLGVLGHL
jgi:LysR family transcriptional regulator, low CO2-responsive transcriptional regulator